jgi:hypothetical protein
MATLVSNDQSARASSIVIDFVDTTWIDFERFSSILGIEKARLYAGTWQGMGIKQGYSRNHGIRHCAECWKEGFHCALFDIEVLAICPLHKCPLSSLCFGCITHSTFNVRQSTSLSGPRFCTRCRNILPRREVYASFNAPLFADAMDRHCSSLLDWWSDVGVKCQQRDVLLCDLLQVGRPVDVANDHRAWQLFISRSVSVKSELDWAFKIKPEGARMSVLAPAQVVDKSSNTITDFQSTQERRNQVAKGYRALRRHLFNRFIRPHSACYNKLIALDKENCLSLDYEKVCLAAVAYLTWRMSIEGLVRVEGLKAPREKNFELQLMRPAALDNLTVEHELIWSYCSFMGIWRKLVQLRGVRNLRIEKSDGYRDGYFYWVGFSDHATDAVTGKLGILYPDIEEIRESKRVCLNRNPAKDSIVDLKWYLPKEFVYVTNDSQQVRVRDVMFQLRHPNNRHVSDRCWYLNV